LLSLIGYDFGFFFFFLSFVFLFFSSPWLGGSVRLFFLWFALFLDDVFFFFLGSVRDFLCVPQLIFFICFFFFSVYVFFFFPPPPQLDPQVSNQDLSTYHHEK